MKKSICYELECSICHERYDGETGRYCRCQKWDHYKPSVNKDNRTAMGSHYKNKHSDDEIPEEGPVKAKVLRKCKDFVDRMIWQSVYIKHNKPEINVQLNNNNITEGQWTKGTWDLI